MSPSLCKHYQMLLAIRMCVYMCMCIYIYIYICTYMCVCVYIYICIWQYSDYLLINSHYEHVYVFLYIPLPDLFCIVCRLILCYFNIYSYLFSKLNTIMFFEGNSKSSVRKNLSSAFSFLKMKNARTHKHKE